MSTPHQAETLNALLATVIAKTRPDGMLKAAESAAAAFKADLAVFEATPAADLAPALLALVRAQTAALKAGAAGEQVLIPVVRHFGGAQVADHIADAASRSAATTHQLAQIAAASRNSASPPAADDGEVDVPVTRKF